MDLDGANDRPRLTAEQKKKNHIESEKKRREAIRRGFEKLAEIVPGVHGQGRSEAVVLDATVRHLKEQIARKEELKREAMAKGMSAGDFEQVYVYRDLDSPEKRVAAGLAPDYEKIHREAKMKQKQDVKQEEDEEASA